MAIKDALDCVSLVRDRLKGLAFKAGKLESSNAAWTGSRAEEAAQMQDGPQQRLVKVLVLAAACVFMVTIGWRIYDDHPSAPIEQQLEQERTVSRDLKKQLDARLAEQELLIKERARIKELEVELTARRSKEQALTLALARELTRSEVLESALAIRSDCRYACPAAPPGFVGRNATPAAPPALVPPDIVTRTEPPVPSQPADPETVARLIARAALLIRSGNVAAARSALEIAAAAGSPLATFTLAESYDPAVLSEWGTVGTRGDAAKARELYAKAAAGGVEAAKGRLEALR
jgi:hypothetical protein